MSHFFFRIKNTAFSRLKGNSWLNTWLLGIFVRNKSSTIYTSTLLFLLLIICSWKIKRKRNDASFRYVDAQEITGELADRLQEFLKLCVCFYCILYTCYFPFLDLSFTSSSPVWCFRIPWTWTPQHLSFHTTHTLKDDVRIFLMCVYVFSFVPLSLS